jgi:hypothetical protein
VAVLAIAVGSAGAWTAHRAIDRIGFYQEEALKWKSEADVLKAELEARPVLAECPAGKYGTLAFANKNPMNVKHLGKQKWLGEIGRDGQGHVKFSSIHYGIRAGVLTLRSYQTRHGIKTLNGIIDRFCGGNADYVRFLSRRLNLEPDEEFQIIPRIPELVLWMSAYESGRRVDPKILASLDILKKI